jgi:membrane associated rhomboid family serine protease
MLRIRYNAPVTLTFTLICALLLALDSLLQTNIIPALFTVPGRGMFDAGRISSYFRLISHVAGHSSWTHLLNNFAFILLLGPILEEKYGSPTLTAMILLTALTTGILNLLFFRTGLLGASGIVFMMILLVSFTNIRTGEIPLTFILVVILYLVREIFATFTNSDTISEFAHIIGGLCGSLFGFFRPGKRLN